MILDRILLHSQEELAHRKRSLPLAELRAMALDRQPALDFASALKGDGIRLIAEVKKASPSKGLICADFDPVHIADEYARSGASAISILTETEFFQGSLDYLRDIGDALGDKRIPLLRKDFLFDRYQIFESRAFGADGLLLIVAILSGEQLQDLLGTAHELGMKCLVEVHNEAEVEIAVKSGAGIIGINNRDLTTFDVDLAVTEKLRPLIPPDRIVVSESGITVRGDIERLKKAGIHAVLVGETLMRAENKAAMVKELLG
jgi:indole-3-glycerol phosphate synthase